MVIMPARHSMICRASSYSSARIPESDSDDAFRGQARSLDLLIWRFERPENRR
jgi:hypothetical protein